MTLTIQSTTETLELVHVSMHKTQKAILYAINEDCYFAVICDKDGEAVYMFNNVDMLLSFVEVNQSKETIDIYSYENFDDMVEFARSVLE